MAPPSSVLPSAMGAGSAQKDSPSSGKANSAGLRNQLHLVTDFSSDVGRKKFGFSHEEIEDSTAYYEGQFKLYQRCGEGTLHNTETGSKYVGQFSNDQFHGQGDQLWADGSRYKGQWRHGLKHGNGEYISADELRYTGQWEDGRRHGQGTQEYANSDRYEGWWFQGLCSGFGTYHFADGSRYEGAWANGRYDGAGVLYGADGSREKHFFNSGLLMKREVLPPLKTGNSAKTPRGRTFVGGKVVFGQSREEMHKPTLLSKPQPSKYLIIRETAGMDLSAPPLRLALPAAGQMAISNGAAAPVSPTSGATSAEGVSADVASRVQPGGELP